MAGSNYVAYNLAQARSDSEKAQARRNIGVEMEIHESILDYTDDWVDISDEFVLFPNCYVYVRNGVIGTVADLHILFSAKRGWVYFNCESSARLIRSTPITTSDNWVPLLRYTGSRIKLPLEGGRFVQNDFIFPIDVSRGESLFLMCSSNRGTRSLCQLGYTNAPNPTDNGIACKMVVNSVDNSYGSLVGNTFWLVDVND